MRDQKMQRFDATVNANELFQNRKEMSQKSRPMTNVSYLFGHRNISFQSDCRLYYYAPPRWRWQLNQHSLRLGSMASAGLASTPEWASSGSPWECVEYRICTFRLHVRARLLLLSTVTTCFTASLWAPHPQQLAHNIHWSDAVCFFFLFSFLFLRNKQFFLRNPIETYVNWKAATTTLCITPFSHIFCHFYPYSTCWASTWFGMLTIHRHLHQSHRLYFLKRK